MKGVGWLCPSRILYFQVVLASTRHLPVAQYRMLDRGHWERED